MRSRLLHAASLLIVCLASTAHAATRVSCATGNWSSSSTWCTADSTSALQSTTGTTALTGSYASSSTFTPGAITVRAHCLMVGTHDASGTISTALDQGGSTVSGTEVTINKSDISIAVTTLQAGQSWACVEYATPVTLLDATAYSVKVKHTGGSASLFRDAGQNWSRLLVTTTTGNAAAGDQLIVVAGLTGAGTKSNNYVTMDNNNSTIYGATSYTLDSTYMTSGSLVVASGGKLTWATGANTELHIRGFIIVGSGGTFEMGTTGARIGSSYTAILEFNESGGTASDSGMRIGHNTVVSFAGATKSVVSTLLTADRSTCTGPGCTLTLASTSGWAANDEIGVAPTGTTTTQYEKFTVSSVDSGTQVTISGNVAYAHSGTTGSQAEVVNLTRNVKVRAYSNTLATSVRTANYFLGATTFTASYAEFYNMGPLNLGMVHDTYGNAATTAGTWVIAGASFHDAGTAGYGLRLGMDNAHSDTTWSISDTVFYNIYYGFTTTLGARAAPLPVLSLTNSTAIGGTNGFQVDHITTMTGNRAAGYSSNGMQITYQLVPGATIDSNVSHSNANGLTLSSVSGALPVSEITGLTVARNNQGVTIAGGPVTLVSPTVRGNTTCGLCISSQPVEVTVEGGTIGSETGFTCGAGVALSQASSSARQHAKVIVRNATLGSPVANTYDVTYSSLSQRTDTYALFENTEFLSSTEVYIASATRLGTHDIYSQRHDTTAGNHKSWHTYGTRQITTGASCDGGSGACEKLTPSSATYKLQSASKQASVANSGTLTVSVKIYMSSDFNGTTNKPRLRRRYNPACHASDADTTLDTATVGVSTWETLSGTTASVSDDCVEEFYVDLEGTVGNVIVDTWSIP